MSKLKVKSTKPTLSMPLSVTIVKLCAHHRVNQIEHPRARGPAPRWSLVHCFHHSMHLVVGDQTDRPIERGVGYTHKSKEHSTGCRGREAPTGKSSFSLAVVLDELVVLHRQADRRRKDEVSRSVDGSKWAHWFEGPAEGP
jgi:hypothetical protein